MAITAEKIQEMIDDSPIEHNPVAYECHVKDIRDRIIGIRYVRASSPRRAELTAVKVSRFILGKIKANHAKVIMIGDPERAHKGCV